MSDQNADMPEVNTSLTVTRDALLKDGSDAQFREMVHALLAFSVRLESIRQEFGAHIGLTGIQYTILISVAHMQGASGLGVNAVAQHLSLSGPFVTIEVGKLVKLDLLTKRTNPDDRRRVLLQTTPKADALLAALTPVQQEVNDVLFDPLSARQFDAMHGLGKQLVDSASKALSLAQYLTGSKGGSQ
jgi:MarR family transcriptional regulator, organic hydroperoxide resistance regulator